MSRFSYKVFLLFFLLFSLVFSVPPFSDMDLYSAVPLFRILDDFTLFHRSSIQGRSNDDR